jgi:hypothetical protein
MLALLKLIQSLVKTLHSSGTPGQVAAGMLGLLVWIFAEPVARHTTEEASSELLGTEVNVGKLDLLPRQASVDLRALQIADPFVLTRNLIEADEIRLKLNPAALAEKKLVIERLTLHGSSTTWRSS